MTTKQAKEAVTVFAENINVKIGTVVVIIGMLSTALFWLADIKHEIKDNSKQIAKNTEDIKTKRTVGKQDWQRGQYARHITDFSSINDLILPDPWAEKYNKKGE